MVRFVVDPTTEEEVIASLGIPELTFFDELAYTGTAAGGLVAHACMAVATGDGQQRTALSCDEREVWGSGMGLGRLPGVGGRGRRRSWSLSASWYRANSWQCMPGRHMYEYGTTSAQFGAISVACRKHANMNPRAIMYGRPMTIEDHQNSRMIYDPFHLLDCCLETDGGAAIVISSAERAQDMRQRPVYVSAVAQSLVPPILENGPISQTVAAVSGPRLFDIAGITPQDIDAAQIYDHFSALVLFALEDYGFCAKGEGGAFVEGGRIEIGGELPINTAGGHLSEAYVHTVNHIIEGVRQLRGCSTAQVPDAEFVLVDTGEGVGAMILRR